MSYSGPFPLGALPERADRHKRRVDVPFFLKINHSDHVFTHYHHPDNVFLWKRNRPTRCTPYIMPNSFNNHNSERQPLWSPRLQRCRLSERARISVHDISIRAVVATAEPQGATDDPATLRDPLHGPYFTRWSRYRRSNLVWDQLETVDGHEDLDTVDELPQRTRNGALRALTGSCNGLSQVPETRNHKDFLPA